MNSDFEESFFVFLEGKGNMTLEDVYLHMEEIAINNPEFFEEERRKILHAFAKQSKIPSTVKLVEKLASVNEEKDIAQVKEEILGVLDILDTSSPKAFRRSQLNQLKMMINSVYEQTASRYGLYALMDKLEELLREERYASFDVSIKALYSLLEGFSQLKNVSFSDVDFQTFEESLEKLKRELLSL